MTNRGRQLVLTAAAAVGGIVLFAYSIARVGADQIADGIERVGLGLLPILGIAGLRFLVRAQCWRLCMPANVRLSFSQALSAFLSADAIGNFTPLGPVASEPTKILLTRSHLTTHESIAALAVDNLLYAASIATMVSVGVVMLLLTAPLDLEFREAATATVAALAVLAALTLAALRRSNVLDAEQVDRTGWRERLAVIRASIVGFSAGHPGRVWEVFGLNLVFHVLSILETFLTLRWLLGDQSPTLAQAIVFEALSRVITVVFKFVPLRVGIDEALSGAFAPLVAISPAAGVSLAVVRKVRNLFWGGIGLWLIAARHVRAAPATDHPESVSARRT